MRIRFFNMFLFVAMLGIVISSCKTPTGQAQRDLEQEYLSKYIAKFHPTVTPKASGLYFIETKAGVATDSLIKAGDLVNVYYSGYLIEDDATNGIQDGYEFDYNLDGFEPFSFTVGAGSVITGWDEAMTYMKDGSEAKLIIPSKLAYSSQSQTSIPAYSPLVFYIKISKVYRSTDVWPTIEIKHQTPVTR
ncbi:MAG TPA: FKBP-type peptidyl-prolyl cis-trans isomerase [Prolixibacteraceae bacterium]|nr:FKBP-type peptidyl-prolyl cis-trans isomerase [Prolixibacteraceae bacterium]